jgi:hypothetical protein
MSKMDNLRAMREARYDKAAARAKQAGGTKPTSAAAPVAPAQVAKAPAPEVGSDATVEELCGHRNMSGRTCTREKGHAAKSHRYS